MKFTDEEKFKLADLARQIKPFEVKPLTQDEIDEAYRAVIQFRNEEARRLWEDEKRMYEEWLYCKSPILRYFKREK